nr:unnamed protein product [Callosobruchus analis]
MIFTIGVLDTNRCYQSHDIVQPCFSDPFLTNQLNYIMSPCRDFKKNLKEQILQIQTT